MRAILAAAAGLRGPGDSFHIRTRKKGLEKADVLGNEATFRRDNTMENQLGRRPVPCIMHPVRSARTAGSVRQRY